MRITRFYTAEAHLARQFERVGRRLGVRGETAEAGEARFGAGGDSAGGRAPGRAWQQKPRAVTARVCRSRRS